MPVLPPVSLRPIALVSRASVGMRVPFLNIRAFGAAGDGVTDDTTALNRAIAALDSRVKGIYIPEGVYVVAGVNAIPSGYTILGDGIGRTVLFKKAGAGMVRPITFQSGGSNISIRDLTLDGNYANNSGPLIDMLCIDHSDYATIDHVEIKNFEYMAIEGYANHVRVLNSIIRGAAIVGDPLNTGSYYGYWCTGDVLPRRKDILIQGCYFENTRTNAIFADAEGLKIVDSHFFGCHTQVSPVGGGQIASGADTSIIDCYFDGNGNAAASGLEINGSTRVAGCTIRNQGRWGIFLQAGTNFVITGNQIVDNNVSNVANDSGIAIANSVGHAVITGNRIGNDKTSTQLYGISIAAGSDYVMAADNDLSGNVHAGVVNSSAGAHITTTPNL